MNKQAQNSEGAIELSESQIDAIRVAYNGAYDRHKLLIEEVGYILSEKLRASRIKVHAIEKRIKELDSTLLKCRRDAVGDFSKVNDIVGARVVCLFRSDLAAIGSLIDKNFEVLEKDDKLESGENPLGYLSIHYLCKIPKEYSGPRYDQTRDMVFEIQVRTLCMHCWAAVSHHLDYKGDWDVPVDLKRALNALSGLFYVADNQFEQFSDARNKSLKDGSSPAARRELNLDTLTAYLRTKFTDRQHSAAAEVSKVVQELKELGYLSIDEVDRDATRAAKAFIEFETAHRPLGGKYTDVGAVRSLIKLVKPEYRNNSAVKKWMEKFDYLVEQA